MIVERIDELSSFRRLRHDWDAIYRIDPEAQLFLSWAWLAGPLETYPGQWTILVARSSAGEVSGILPLRTKTSWSRSRRQLRNELHFAGRLFWADYGGFLCHPEHEPEAIMALTAELQTMHWSHLHLKGLRTSQRRQALFLDALQDPRLEVEYLASTANGGGVDNLVCPYIELPDDFERYLTTISRSTRQKIRRYSRRMDTKDDYRIAATTPSTRTQDLAALEGLWADMWRYKKRSHTDGLAAKYAAIIGRGLDDSLVHLCIMSRGDTPVGALAGFVDRQKAQLLFFVSGRDRTVNDVPVGLLLHAHTIEWAIENEFKTYDLLRGDEPYKYSLGATDRRIIYPLVRTVTGTNLNDSLDRRTLDQALQRAADYAISDRSTRAAIICRQVLDLQPDHPHARSLLATLT